MIDFEEFHSVSASSAQRMAMPLFLPSDLCLQKIDICIRTMRYNFESFACKVCKMNIYSFLYIGVNCCKLLLLLL